MRSRDVRFDGQFFTGVRSTGIYCRPSCPATTPLERNVTFFATVAAAHQAGLRACRRCLPDAVPGSPRWNLDDDLASRAMRLIADGEVDRSGVPGLAARLGYTPRHLGRVLVRELGAGPLALARAQRAQTARALLVGTDMAVADIAFASGFTSIRQCNATINEVYRLSPTEVRARAGHRALARPEAAGHDHDGGATTLTLRLPARGPFDHAGLFTHFADHAIAGMEQGDATSFRRAVRLPHGRADLELRVAGDTAVDCTVRLERLADVSAVVSRVRRMLDLDADSTAIAEQLSVDPALAPIVAANGGIRIPGSLDADETLFRTLLGQQISVAAARTVLGRVVTGLSPDPTLFPTATELAERGHEVLRGPASRIRSIILAAEALASGDLVLDIAMPVEELTARLVAMPGIGPWTAGYVAMRVLGAPDVLLASDLIMQEGARRIGAPSTARGLLEHGARWAPWRSYAGLLLWRAADR